MGSEVKTLQMTLLFKASIGLIGLAYVSGHANMVWPKTWFDKGGAIGMSPGGQCATEACMWFNNFTFISGEPTLPDDMRTFQDMNINGFMYDFTKTHPWRHPGSAPIFSPCGVGGGNPNGCPAGEGQTGDNCPGGGYAYGPAAEDVEFQDVVETE